MGALNTTMDGTVHRVDDLVAPAAFAIAAHVDASTFAIADGKNKEPIWARNNHANPPMTRQILWRELSVHRRFMTLLPGLAV